MKRVCAVLLLVAVSLSLWACGQADPRIEKYETIIHNLENGNYQAAIDLIENMAQQNGGGANTNATAVPTEPTKPGLTPEQLAWKADAVGTWIPDEVASKAGHTGFSVKADGTCVVDGKDYTWEIGHSSKNNTQITVLDGEKKAYMLQLSINGSYGYKRASLFTYTDANNAQGGEGTYYRNEDYTVVEITNDNWQDYFELKEVVNAEKNAFGEHDKLRSQNGFRLKDAESVVNGALSSGGVEYKYVSACLDVTVDFEKMTYTTSETRNSANHNSTAEAGYYTDPKGAQYYGVSIGGFVASGLDKNQVSTVWRPTNIEILRVQCTLYLVKK